MPLYKLTERRLQKRAREDEDGTTRLKAALREMGEMSGSEEGEGWSEGSDSSDNEGEGEGSSEEDEDDEGDEGETDEDEDQSDGDDDDDEDEEEGEEGSLVEDDISDGSSEQDFSMTIESALQNPIYDADGDIRLCVLCPGRMMKNEHMVKVHLDSNAHKRAARRYQARLQAADQGRREIRTTDPRVLVEEILEELEQPQPQQEQGQGQGQTQLKSKNKSGKNVGPAEETSTSTGTTPPPPSPPEKTKRRKADKKKRKEERAQKLLQLQLQRASADSGKGLGEQAGGAGEGVKLNRKARRLLEAQNKGSGAQPHTQSQTSKRVEVGETKKRKVKA